MGKFKYPTKEEYAIRMNDEDALSKASFEDIRYMRDLFPDQESQNKLAGYDRRSYARELYTDKWDGSAGNLLSRLTGFALPVLSVGEEALKYAGYNRGRSEPNFGNVLQTQLGVLEGATQEAKAGAGQLFNAAQQRWKQFVDK